MSNVPKQRSQKQCRSRGSDKLCQPVSGHAPKGKVPGQGESKGHTGIHVRPGDMADGVNHGCDNETEGDCDSDVGNLTVRDPVDDNGATACEYEGKGSHCLGYVYAKPPTVLLQSRWFGHRQES